MIVKRGPHACALVNGYHSAGWTGRNSARHSGHVPESGITLVRFTPHCRFPNFETPYPRIQPSRFYLLHHACARVSPPKPEEKGSNSFRPLHVQEKPATEFAAHPSASIRPAIR